METKYGFIVIIVEYGRKKIDFNKCTFNKIDGLFTFLNNVEFLKQITL